MAETIRLSSAVKWFAQAIESFRLEYEIDPNDPNYGITHANRRLQRVLDPNEEPCRKIEDCILLASTLLSIAWSEHCKIIELDKEKL
jgi:hypothetical protein